MMYGKTPGAGKLRRRALLLSTALALLAGTPMRAQSISTVMNEVRFEQRINQALPLDTPFRDEAGRAVQLKDHFGRRPVVLAFVYYECPMLCTFVLNGLVKGLKPLRFEPGREFDVVVISIAPKETPSLAAEKKLAYVKDFGRMHTLEGWHFLTGEEAHIRRVTDAAGFFYTYDAESQQYAHASGIMVATPEGKLFRYFYGIEYAPRDLRFALMEASQNKIGTPVDQVLLYCFHYDPKTGKYGVLITRVIRLAGTATVLVLGTFLVLMFRRERQLSRAVAHGQTRI